jgi:Tol biopolymer transport system component
MDQSLTGSKLAHYELLEKIGAGGMGEVYRAHDPRLGRDVAIKICAERFSDRFEREARTVAALNHPHICTIYDVGPNYLVMELVEGPTLADRIARGALPLAEALEIAQQIGEALEAAHEKGIVHRDLKPANVKITPQGVVKVLDFGLAKAMQEPAGSSENSPTLTIQATQAGMLVGTAAYMAPEQACGKSVDQRADIWAFGVVLYEMLAGRRLFDGGSVAETLTAVLSGQPSWDRVPAKARRLLQSCLEKEPKRRLRHIGDAWRLLEEAPQAAPVSRKLPWALAGAAALSALVFGALLWLTPRAVEQPPVRVDLDLGAAVPSLNIGASAILSPDGTRLVLVAQGSGGKSRLLTRLLDQPKMTEMAGTEGAFAPFFSPDGQWVGFFAAGKLKKIRVSGGDPIPLCDAPAGRGASWTEDNTIIAALDTRRSLSLIPAEGGAVSSVGNLDVESGELNWRWPHVLPRGRAVLFVSTNVPDNYSEGKISVVSLADHRKKTLLERGGMYPRYLPSGHLAYVRKGVLLAVPFDLDRLEVRGAAKPILEDVANDPNYGSAQFDFSRNGTMLYRKGRTEGLRTLQWLDASGKTAPLLAEPTLYQYPQFSPDGTRIAAAVAEGPSSNIWVYDWRRGGRNRLTTGWDSYPVWAPDGRYLVFHSPGGMSWVPADGAGKRQVLTRSKAAQFPASFTPDGSRLLFAELNPEGGSLIRALPMGNTAGQPHAGQPESLLQTTTGNSLPALSPDGRWMAYADAESGPFEVFVRAYPDRGTKWQVSTSGGSMPVWSPNGHELFYRTDDQRIMVANYMVKGDSFIPEKPRLWSETQLANTGVTANFALAPDGKRFAVLMPADAPEPAENRSHFTLLLNFRP